MKRTVHTILAVILGLAASLALTGAISGGNAQDGVRTGLAGRIANRITTTQPTFSYGAGAGPTLGLNDLAAGVADALSNDKVALSSQVEPGTLTCGSTAYVRHTGSAWECTTPAQGTVPVYADAPLSGDGSSGSHLTCTSASASVGGCLTNGTQSIAGNKTFTGTLTVSTASPGLLTQEAWTAVTFSGTWANYDAANYASAAYMRDSLGFVHLRGVVKSGTVNTTIFTLPAGYRPSKRENFAVWNNTGACVIEVRTDGTVVQVAGGNTLDLQLGGITFDTR